MVVVFVDQSQLGFIFGLYFSYDSGATLLRVCLGYQRRLLNLIYVPECPQLCHLDYDISPNSSLKGREALPTTATPLRIVLFGFSQPIVHVVHRGPAGPNRRAPSHLDSLSLST